MDALLNQTWPSPFKDIKEPDAIEEGESCSHAVDGFESNSGDVKWNRINICTGIKEPNAIVEGESSSHAVDGFENNSGDVKWNRINICTGFKEPNAIVEGESSSHAVDGFESNSEDVKWNQTNICTDIKDPNTMAEGESSSHAVDGFESNSEDVKWNQTNIFTDIKDPNTIAEGESSSHAVDGFESNSGDVKWSQTSILENILKEPKGADEAKAVDRDLQDQDDELRALGIAVVDQLSLERDVEAAVDKAVSVHARKQRMQMLKREIQDVNKQVKQGDMKLGIMSERLSGMQRRVVDPRQYFSVEKEMKSKDEQLKALRSRADYLKQKLSAAESNEAELDDFEFEDGEVIDDDDDNNQSSVTGKASRVSGNDKERQIREGQMTPFGTAMTSSSSKTISVMRPSYTQGEQRKIQAACKKKSKAAKEVLISSGVMTPFGSVIKTKKKVKADAGEMSGSVNTDFEKYLQDQIDRQKEHSDGSKGIKRKKSSGDPNYGISKRRKKPKEYVGDVSVGEADGGTTSLSAIKKKIKSEHKTKGSKVKNSEAKRKPRSKDPIKMKILHPKQKRQQKVALGSVTSELEADQYKETPRRILSERMAFDGGDSDNSYCEDNSGSEYVPSDDDALSIDPEEWQNIEGDEEGKSQARQKADKPKRKRKTKVKKEDETSDDDDELAKSKGRRPLKEVDDGNIDDYVRRIELWKEERLKHKHAKILRGEDLDSEEEEEEGYEEFDGGFKVPLAIWNKLYKYQRTCVKWMWELHTQGCGGILGDEMGLGKTIQVIAFLVGLSFSRLSERHQRWKGLGPVLIVCPATVMHQWVKEFHKWWPPFRVAVLHESGSFTGKRPALIHNINKYDGILITSYTGGHGQIETLLQYKWHYVILDEGHKIRNPQAQIAIALKRFQTPHRVILSGSPIQNSLKELWSLFDFVFPGKLGTLPVFLAEFAVPITHGGYANASKIEVQTAFKCASVLRDTINPYLLRRMKNDVRHHLSLPDKNEQVLFCSLTEEQRSAYQGYINGDQVKCIMGGRMKVFVGLINLRKICNHPDLYTGGPRNNDDNYESRLQPELKYGYWGRSGKMHVLQSILRLWSKQGHRVLLFTQSRQMMCILEKFLIDEDHTYFKMDGTTSVSSRQPLIQKFNEDESVFVFLLTTRVGGIGVNLTGADRVIIFDPDWNPSTDAQARERAWRIGQLRHVTIYRLLTSGTIEEKIYHRQIFKQFLTNRVLKDPKQQRFFKTNDLYELFTLNEGLKEKTESSAIFAGTNSEIKVNVDEDAKDSDDEDEHLQNSTKNMGSDARKGRPHRDEFANKGFTKTKDHKSKKYKSPAIQEKEISNSKTKMEDKHRERMEEKNKEKMEDKHRERMRELAKRISLNIAKKSSMPENSSSAASTSVDTRQKDNIPEDTLPSGDSTKKEFEDNLCSSESFDDGIEQGIDEMDDDLRNTVDNLIDSIKEESFACENVLDRHEEGFKKEIDSGNEGVGNVIKEEHCNGSEEKQSDYNIDIVKYEMDRVRDDAPDVDSRDSSVSLELKRDLESGNSPDNGQHIPSPGETDSSEFKHPEKHKKKHKNKYKHREKKEKHRDKEKKSGSHRKGRKIDGARIDYLVKKRNYRKTEEEEASEKQNAKSQDEYVLTKLFQKSGVHTALSHDSILSNNDPDYLLMEGEAERVAKEALKAVRASRARCFRPWPTASSSETPESKKSKKPKFGSKKNKMFADSGDREVKKDELVKEKKEKTRMFNGGLDDEDDDAPDAGSGMDFKPKKKIGSSKLSEGLSSAQLLSRIHQRNKTVGSMELTNEESNEDYDPDYPSTAAAVAAQPEEEVDEDVQENIDLLADIRNFIAFQAEVDGSASTQEIISRFSTRLPPEQTPFFKALLTKICDFHRKSSGEGVWSLKEEFR